jgi:hypothetical protein
MWKHNEDRIRSIRHRNVGFLLAGTRSRRCANKSKCAKPQNTLVLGEDAVKDLLLLMEPDKNGKISKQAWMRFMAEEFDRLDKDQGRTRCSGTASFAPADQTRFSARCWNGK